MPYYSLILPSVFVNGAPHALIAQTKKQPITRAGGDTFKSPIFLPHVWVAMGGSVLEAFKTSTFKSCHIICQLGLALKIVDGVKAGLLKPTLSIS
jgi:hypothetical protein